MVGVLWERMDSGGGEGRERRLLLGTRMEISLELTGRTELVVVEKWDEQPTIRIAFYLDTGPWQQLRRPAQMNKRNRMRRGRSKTLWCSNQTKTRIS